MRVIVRRERPHPGAQLRFTDIDGHRFTAFATDAERGQLDVPVARAYCLLTRPRLNRCREGVPAYRDGSVPAPGRLVPGRRPLTRYRQGPAISHPEGDGLRLACGLWLGPRRGERNGQPKPADRLLGFAGL